MSMVPADDEKTVVCQRSELVPSDKAQPPGPWRRFVNRLRDLLGFQTLELAERFGEAKVQDLEISNEQKKLKALGDYERVQAEIRQMDEQTTASKQKRERDAEIHRLAVEHLKLSQQSPEQLGERLREIITQIAMAGGSVAICPPDPDAEDPEEQSEPDE